MLKYLIIILGDSSVSFCYYNSKKKTDIVRRLISYENLKKAVTFALKNNLKVNFLYPNFRPEKKYEQLIEDVEHIKIVPAKLHKVFRDSILVVKSEDMETFSLFRTLKDANIILWLRYEELNRLFTYIRKLIPKSRRINLIIQGTEKFREIDLVEYRKQINKISGLFLKSINGMNFPEMNFLTDRLVLEKMNSCEAGLTHLTAAPNGKLYLCPGFYYENENNTVGVIKNEIVLKNKHLLELKYAPICRICDAYQCKRCVFMNKKLTSEINTPSSQQCRTSHAERETSRLLIEELKQAGKDISGFNEIRKLDYDDPYETMENNKFSISEFKEYKANAKDTN